MFLDIYGIKLYIRDLFPINLCGVEASVENYQTYLISCCAVMGFESYGICFFFVLSLISRSLSISIITHILFSLHILLLAVEMSDRQAF